MLFVKYLRDGVRSGEITTSVRVWQRPHVQAGKRYRMEGGEIEIDSIVAITFDDITPDLARACGFKDVIGLLNVAKHGPGDNVYLVRFHYIPSQRSRVSAPASQRARNVKTGGGRLRAKARLSQAMTVRQFDNGYWYATELRDFAKTIGIPAAAKLRKDELETAIKAFLETGRIANPAKRDLERRGEKDVALGLRLDRPVLNYTNDRETKKFLEEEARILAPHFKRKSGSRYRLNRWREEQLATGVKITYGDLVREYVRLNQSEILFARIPHGRYINFMSDFLSKEADATREDAIKAWQTLKGLDMPKTYESWRKLKSSTKRR